MIRALVSASLFVACTGQAPAPATAPAPDRPTGFAAAPSKGLRAADPQESGVRTLSADTVRRAFEPVEVRQGEGGLRCAAFVDRVIVTRPGDHGGRDLRIRPRDFDLEEDCAWDGPVLVETRVAGEVLGMVWPHVVVYEPSVDGFGHLQVVQGATGGMLIEFIDALEPAYVKSLTLGFAVPAPLPVDVGEGEACDAAIARVWHKVRADWIAAGRLARQTPTEPPTCPAEVLATCQPVLTLPFELVLGQTEASAAVGPVGCRLPARGR